jgi:KDO2-lipid IV(A) lauroyltransferase
MPLAGAQSFGRFLGSLGYLLSRRRRLIALENLRHAFPEKTEREIKSIARKAFESYTISISEFLWFPKLTPSRLRKLVRVSNIDLVGEVYSRKKGIIFMTGHFGNWELAALSTAHFSGYPLTIIVKGQRNPYVDRVINQLRCLWGNSVVPMEFSVREVLRKLALGQAVAMVADQSAQKEALRVPFFGRAAAAHEGPAVFSLRTGAPLLVMFLTRQADGGYEGTFEEVISDDLRSYSEENVAELTRRHTALLEKCVRKYPEQWLWMHRRWKHVEATPKPQPSRLGRVVDAES